jgi:benzoyl-CoA reductase/2-hydroxyglutaryl-CoA dehydratase subunit BcrC/BadD/HgdB
MKLILKIVALFLMIHAVPVKGQDNPSSKEEKKNEVATRRAKRLKAKKEWKESRQKDHSNDRAVRRHEKRLQTKETRKRMRQNRKKANRNNEHKKEFFLIRLFKPKPKTGGW